MKLKMYFSLLALGACALTLQSCDDNDDRTSVSSELTNALAKQHPQAQRIEWDTKGTHFVADFKEGNFEKEAWFTADGVWQMTETDISYTDLPGFVQSTYEASAYHNVWRVEDVDMLERKDVATLYVIEIEKKGEQDKDLYYSKEGILMKEVVDTDNDHDSEGYLPPVVSDAIKDLIAKKYPDARIVEIEKEANGMTEVEIVDKNIRKEVLLNADGTWNSTVWDISKAHLENGGQAVLDAIAAEYPGYVIDDVEFVETATNTKGYFLIELEQGGKELKVKVTSEGELLP